MTAWVGRLVDTGLESLVDAEKLGQDGCEARAPGGAAYLCTRRRGHAGRHLAQGSFEFFAAWPGEAEPTLADLEAVPA